MADENVEVQGGLTNVTAGKSGALTPAGKIALDPTQTGEILRNMQAMIDERTGPLSQLNRGLERAAAWTVPNTEGLKTQALSSVGTKQAAEDQSLFNMRTQMAAYKAAQAQAERFRQQAESQIGAGTPTAGGKINPEAQMPPQIRQALQNAMAQNDQAGYDKIYNAWAQKQAEVYANPNMDKPEIPVVENVNGQFVRRMVSARQYRENPSKYQDTPETQAAVQSVAAPAGGDVLPKLKQAVFGTESSGGKADTTKPGIQGAIGPMQVTPDTWETNVARGIIPKEFDINNPAQNKAAGEKILDYYYKQYNGDVDKTLAAYHGGEGAINKDGSINLDRRDKLGTSIGEYIAKNKSAMGVAPAIVAPTQAAPVAGPRPTPEQLEQQSAVQQAGSLEAAKETGKEVGKLAAEVVRAGQSAPERENRSRDIVDLATDKELNKYIGMFTKKGTAPFVIRQIESGVNAGQFGVVGIADLKKNLTQASAPTAVIEKLDRLEKNLNATQLEYAQTYLKGQGAVSDAERRLIASVVGNYVNNPAKFIELQGRVMQERAQFDARVNDAWSRYKDQYGTYADFDKFLRTDGRSLVDQHKKDLGTITGADTSKLGNPFQIGATPTGGSSSSGTSDISSFHFKKK